MGKDRNLFERYDFTIFLAVFCILALSYPFLVSGMCSRTIFYFLFITWILIIMLLMVFSCGDTPDSKKDDHDDTIGKPNA